MYRIVRRKALGLDSSNQTAIEKSLDKPKDESQVENA